jgi:Tol biopolymer transport system component
LRLASAGCTVACRGSTDERAVKAAATAQSSGQIREERMPVKPRVYAALATLISLAAMLALVLVLAPPRAPATFGGKNGRIAFASTPTLTDEGNFEIYTMKADGSDAKRLTNNAAFDAGPTFSPDGKRIAFVSHRDGNYEIYLMNADGTDQQRLTDNPAADRQPAFSPDGKRIAFASDRDGNFEIYLMKADGSDQHRLTHRRLVDDDPTFFPSGNKIAFVRGGAGFLDIFTMRADGTQVHRLTHHSPLVTPDVSPNGKRIVAWVPREAGAIEVMRADGTHLHGLGTHGLTPVFSPNGKKIAFERATMGGSASRIFVMRADGSNRHALTMPPHRFNGFPDWGPRP